MQRNRTQPARPCHKNRHARVSVSILTAPAFVELPKSAILVFLLLLSHRNADGLAWPGMRRLAKDLRLTLGTVCTAVGALKASGLVIAKMETAGEPRRWRYVYRFVDRSAESERTTVQQNPNAQGDRPFGKTRTRDRSDFGVPTVRIPLNKTVSEQSQEEHSNTTTTSVLSPVGKSAPTSQLKDGGGGDASQGSKEPIADVDQPEVWQALVKCGIGEPALSELAGDPRIDAGMVRRVAAGCGELGQGGGILIRELQRTARANELKVARETLDRKEAEELEAALVRRAERYKELLGHAADDQRAIIRQRWKYPSQLAEADPIQGEQLFELRPDQALNTIIDAVHGAPT